jgi:hypothetical protein
MNLALQDFNDAFMSNYLGTPMTLMNLLRNVNPVRTGRWGTWGTMGSTGSTVTKKVAMPNGSLT